MGKTTREKKDQINLIVFILLSVVILGGWIYGFTWTGSDLRQAFSVAPWYMNVLGVVFFLLGSFVTYRISSVMARSEKRNTWPPVVIAIIVTVLLSIALAANFWNGSY